MLNKTVQHLCNLHGVERVGMLTLTFADHVTDAKEAQRRFHSLRTNVLSKRYVDFVRVLERQASGRIHYHLVVVTRADIRSGVNFEEFANKTYKSANAELRAEWLFWRRNASAYGFGRTELLPVKTNAEAVGRYVGKYISKHVGQRLPADRGIRLVSYSRSAKIGTTNFAWASSKSWLWRAKLAKWALRHGCDSMEAVAALFGPRWAYHHRTHILATQLDYWPTAAHAALDGFWLPPELREDAIHIYRSVANKISAESSSCDSSQAARGVVPPEPKEQREPGGEGSGSNSNPPPPEWAEHKRWIDTGASQLRKMAAYGKLHGARKLTL
jgi:hypothetical protein